MSSSTTPATEIDVDRLVALYTVPGRDERQGHVRRRQRRRAAAVAATVACAAALAWYASGGRFVVPQHADGTDGLRALVSAELAELTAARAELAVERDRFAKSSHELETQLAEFAERHAALAAQQTELTQQGSQLRAALAEVDAQRAALVAAQSRGPDVEGELASIGVERRALEERWQTFANQGQRLSTELDALERQRNELESQRAAVETQRKELESLLDAAGAGASIGADALESTPADAALDPLLATAVDPSQLGELRGGIMFGNGMNVDIGLTRTAAINGEERYSSSLRLDDLAAGLDPAALQSFGPLVLQSGSGNYLSPAALEGLSTGFGTIVQNSLDNQLISTTTIYDVSISDVASAVRDAAASQAVAASLSFQH